MSGHPQPAALFLVAQLNAKLQPIHRGEHFEDPLNDMLEREGIGEVSGGGTMQAESKEIMFCDIEIQLPKSSPEIERLIIDTLERLGAPKGSKLTILDEDREIAFGVAEGLAVYLNGTDLPDETYQQCDANFVCDTFSKLLEGEGRVLSHWQGPTETALYMYGGSYAAMRSRLADFISTYPLCQKCRIEQIA